MGLISSIALSTLATIANIWNLLYARKDMHEELREQVGGQGGFELESVHHRVLRPLTWC